jgi:hypothetical protein
VHWLAHLSQDCEKKFLIASLNTAEDFEQCACPVHWQPIKVLKQLLKNDSKELIVLETHLLNCLDDVDASCCLTFAK